MKADFFSIIIYWSALILSILFCKLYQKRQPSKLYSKIFYVTLICLPLSMVAGARYAVGTDYLTYLEYYELNSSYSLSYILENYRFEDGFFMFNRLCYFLSNGSVFFYFFAIEFFILCLAVSGFIQFSNRISLPVAFFLYYILFYHFSLNGIRSAIAISFLILSYKYLLEDKWLKYYVLIALGFFFHRTILLCALYPFVFFFSGKYKADGSYIKNTKRSITFFLFIVLSIFILGSALSEVTHTLFTEQYDTYLDSAEGQIGIGTIVMFFLYVIPMFWFNWEYIKSDKTYARLRDLSILYIPVSIIGYFAVWASRLNLFAFVALLFLFSIADNDRKIKKWTSVYSLIICFLMYFINVIINNFSQTFPYKFLIF